MEKIMQKLLAQCKDGRLQLVFDKAKIITENPTKYLTK